MKKGLMILLVMVGCAPTLPTYEIRFSGNTIDVPVAGFESSNYNIVADDTNPYNILLIKDSPGAYHALYLKCTYHNEAVEPAVSEIVCPICGSIYNFDGTVKKGPAETDLSRFNTELNPEQTLVKIDISPLGR